jgi:hypothetical protein
MKTLLAVLAAVALVPATASAATITRSSAPVEATLEYHDRDDGPGKVADRLTIARDGTVLFDAKPEPDGCDTRFCGPTVGFGRAIQALSVLDLEGDEEPEVIYQAYTGGAHCCFVAQIYSLNAAGTRYRATDHFFGDVGFTLRPANTGGNSLDFFSADWRFDSVFTAHAASGKPIRILRFDDGELVDVTDSYRVLIRRDARKWRKLYVRTRDEDTGGAQLGAAAAWAADRYRLGKRDATLRLLKRHARRGFLRGPGKVQGRRFVRRLDGFLLRLGYAGGSD